MKLKVNCSNCWKPFETYRRINKGKEVKNYYCSSDCYKEFRNSRFKPWMKAGKLTLIEFVDWERKSRYKVLRCKCDCWNETKITTNHRWKTLSCWCLFKTAKGRSYDKMYKIWRWLLDRCNNKTLNSYSNYGGRWITVGYKDYDDFLADMWERPWPWYTVDRIDNNKWYEPWNCRWATYKEQENHRRNNVKCIINGEEHTLQERSEKLWIPRWTLKKYIIKGKIDWVLYNYKHNWKWYW